MENVLMQSFNDWEDFIFQCNQIGCGCRGKYVFECLITDDNFGDDLQDNIRNQWLCYYSGCKDLFDPCSDDDHDDERSSTESNDSKENDNTFNDNENEENKESGFFNHVNPGDFLADCGFNTTYLNVLKYSVPLQY